MNIELNKNEDAMKLAWAQARQRLEKIYEGGGKKINRKTKGKKQTHCKGKNRIFM